MVLLGRGVGGQVVSAGGDNVSGLSGDKGTVGVGHKSGVSVASGVGDGGNGGNGQSLGGKVGSFGGNDLRGLGGGNGTVGVGDEATGVSSGVGVSTISSIGVAVVSVSSSIGVGTGVTVGVSGEGSNGQALGGEVSSLSGDDLGGLGGGDGAVGVGHQLGGRGTGQDSGENL